MPKEEIIETIEVLEKVTQDLLDNARKLVLLIGVLRKEIEENV